MGQVAEAFNQMAAQLEHQEGLRRQMVADVAHELRTPLTVIRSNLEAMLDGLIAPSDAELGELYDEVRRLSRLIRQSQFRPRFRDGEIVSTLSLDEVETNVGILDTAFTPPVELPPQ